MFFKFFKLHKWYKASRIAEYECCRATVAGENTKYQMSTRQVDSEQPSNKAPPVSQES